MKDSSEISASELVLRFNNKAVEALIHARTPSVC